MSDSRERDADPYVLGTDDNELGRLRLQHDLWRPRVVDLWSQAGIGAGVLTLTSTMPTHWRGQPCRISRGRRRAVA